jgi:hypothetical protein
VDELTGFVADARPGTPAFAFAEAYKATVGKAVKEAYVGKLTRDDPLTMVFAKHRDFSAARIGQYFDLWDDRDGKLNFGGVGDPAKLPPLQVADIVAYELSRWRRDEKPERERYPMARLKEAFAIKGHSARFILTFVP